MPGRPRCQRVVLGDLSELRGDPTGPWVDDGGIRSVRHARLLATLVREEIRPREASNERSRLRAAGLAAQNTLEGFDIKASSLPTATLHFLASLEWPERKDNMSRRSGVGKSHLAQTLGRAAIAAGRKIRFFRPIS